jgi:hypothetical protein
VDRHVLEAVEDNQAKDETECAHYQAAHEERAAFNTSQKRRRPEVGQFQVRLAGILPRLRQKRRRQEKRDEKRVEHTQGRGPLRAHRAPLDTERVRIGCHLVKFLPTGK